MLEVKNGSYTIKPLPEHAGGVFKEVIRSLSLVNYWVSAGTALGLYRDKDFIKGDTDLDIAMEWKLGLERKVCQLVGGEVIRTVYEDGKPMQIALIKDHCIVDIYFHHRNGKNLENHGESGWTRMPKDLCLKPQWIKTKYGKVPIPQEKYFEIRYGKDWEIPQDKKPIFYEV